MSWNMLTLPVFSYLPSPLKSPNPGVGVSPVNPLLPNRTDSYLRGGILALCRSGDDGRLIAKSANPAAVDAVPVKLESAADTVRKFYERFNDRDLEFLGNIISQDCTYEDLVFTRPFIGREAIMEFFKKFMVSTSKDLQFVIDDISEEDESAVGVTWHLEWRGKAFPFSKGCSFYRCGVINGERQIVYGRDCVEPAIKPGDAALVAIGAVTRLLEKIPALIEFL